MVALPELGRVNALKDGETYNLAVNLATPSAVAVLSDSSVLVAEQAAGRVSGFGGRFGPVPVPIAEVPSPTGLVVGPGSTTPCQRHQCCQCDILKSSHRDTV